MLLKEGAFRVGTVLRLGDTYRLTAVACSF